MRLPPGSDSAALEEYGWNGEGSSWGQCCSKVVERANALGLKLATNLETVMRWNIQFREKDRFLQPNVAVRLGKKPEPQMIGCNEDYCAHQRTYPQRTRRFIGENIASNDAGGSRNNHINHIEGKKEKGQL